jgi:hypothetical protein
LVVEYKQHHEMKGTETNTMLRKVVLLAALLPCFAASSAGAPITPTKPIILFNGKNLEGFYTWIVNHQYQDPARVVAVVDRIDGAPAIRVSGEEWGGFATAQEYSDYRLIVEFRWGSLTWGDRMSRSRDSGILVHCQGKDGNTGKDFNGPWMRSIEAQLIEGGVADFILVSGFEEDGTRISPSAKSTVRQDRDGEWVFDPRGQIREFTSGRINWFARDPDWQDVLGVRGIADVENPWGQWNRVEVICRGNEITNFVNGTRVNHLSDSTFTGGKIMFQSEGAEVYFRRIEIHPLDQGQP